LLISLNRYFDVIGFDISIEKINSLYNSDDFNDIIDKDELKKLNCKLSSDENTIKDANFFIITVPTPIDIHNDPDLSMIISATRLVGKNMTKNSIIVYESTVYPGVTEEICLPILEKESGLTNKIDFWVGYSPERINPGDRVHNVENIVKVIASQDEYSLNIIESVYKKIIKAGVYRAKNIKTAEAAKAIENTQRDLNIALINELAIIFSKLGLDTREVLSTARTKWNFLDFYPGLVGGHCIGVDPYYLTFKAEEVGYHPEVILAGRKINDNMAFFIGDEILKRILNNGKLEGRIKVILFGLSFKENIKDIRNSKVPDIRSHLMQYGIDVDIIDPVVNSLEAKKEYGINLIGYEDIRDASAVVFCVAHDCFKNIDLKALRLKLKKEKPYLFDIKGIFDKENVEKYGFNYWRL
jgi:UDP-N-acetyl-D-glucosamine/UDP-N-acetyl-D-galactosamine dehydrogenase